MRERQPTPVPDLRIRRAEPADALSISVMGMQVFLQTYAPTGVSPSLAREVMQGLGPDAIERLFGDLPTTLLVAEAAGHLVGFAQLNVGARHELLGDRSGMELARLYVLEPFTGRGVGKALLARAEAEAAAAQAPLVWLTTWIGNARALAFYAHQGYRQAGSTLYTFENQSHENKLFVKTLAAP